MMSVVIPFVSRSKRPIGGACRVLWTSRIWHPVFLLCRNGYRLKFVCIFLIVHGHHAMIIFSYNKKSARQSDYRAHPEKTCIPITKNYRQWNSNKQQGHVKPKSNNVNPKPYATALGCVGIYLIWFRSTFHGENSCFYSTIISHLIEYPCLCIIPQRHFNCHKDLKLEGCNG